MRHNEVIYLISSHVIVDELGNQETEQTERLVYANEYSSSSTEMASAGVSNLRKAKVFEIYSFEYNDEDKLKHNDLIYSITRPDKRGEKMRITCERDVGNG